jgi:hypothetical protein
MRFIKRNIKNNIFSSKFIMTKFTRTSNGKYSVSGKTYETLVGTRAQVWHGTSYKTSGGLTHNDLLKNKAGRIVSKTKHNTAKREKRLVKAGYLTKKGHFGFIKKGSRKSKRGGTGAPMGSGFPNDSPMGKVLSHGGSRRRKHKGGSVNLPLSPSPVSGISSTSGVDLQFVAGNAG